MEVATSTPPAAGGAAGGAGAGAAEGGGFGNVTDTAQQLAAITAEANESLIKAEIIMKPEKTANTVASKGS